MSYTTEAILNGQWEQHDLTDEELADLNAEQKRCWELMHDESCQADPQSEDGEEPF